MRDYVKVSVLTHAHSNALQSCRNRRSSSRSRVMIGRSFAYAPNYFAFVAHPLRLDPNHYISRMCSPLSKHAPMRIHHTDDGPLPNPQVPASSVILLDRNPRTRATYYYYYNYCCCCVCSLLVFFCRSEPSTVEPKMFVNQSPFSSAHVYDFVGAYFITCATWMRIRVSCPYTVRMTYVPALTRGPNLRSRQRCAHPKKPRLGRTDVFASASPHPPRTKSDRPNKVTGCCGRQ